MSSPKTTRRLNIESLEDRRLMAGSIAFAGGMLATNDFGDVTVSGASGSDQLWGSYAEKETLATNDFGDVTVSGASGSDRYENSAIRFDGGAGFGTNF